MLALSNWSNTCGSKFNNCDVHSCAYPDETPFPTEILIEHWNKGQYMISHRPAGFVMGSIPLLHSSNKSINAMDMLSGQYNHDYKHSIITFQSYLHHSNSFNLFTFAVPKRLCFNKGYDVGRTAAYLGYYGKGISCRTLMQMWQLD